VNSSDTLSPRGVQRPAKPTFNRFLTLLFVLCGIALILYLDVRLRLDASLPDFSRDMSYGLLFTVGFLTGFHCVGMCGALVIGYASKCEETGRLRYGGHLLYGLGKTLSYTAIGGILGMVGALVAFTPHFRGVIGVAAGIFLLLFGLGLLNIFPELRNFRIKTPPVVLKFIGTQSRRYGHPFVIGLLNGLMVICGPLQAMYVMAAGTGSPVEGAKLMLVFGLGTLPVMLGFGVLTSAASARLAPKILRLSGAIVMVLGAVMLNRGLILTGSGYDFTSGLAWAEMAVKERFGINLPEAGPNFHDIEMDFSRKETLPGTPIVLKKGVPVKWHVQNSQMHSCVSSVIVPKLGLEIPLKDGQKTIEFTPQQEGVITWSCDMGMTTGSFVVVDESAGTDAAATKQETQSER
jgi:sulfite exporter TauE/SafE